MTAGESPESPATRREVTAATPRDEPLAANRDFRVLLGSQGVSALGDAVSFTALPLLVLALTGSGLAMGIVGALQTLPDLVFGMVAGALADRSDRKRMMFLADLGRAVLTASIPISVFLNGPTMVVILIVAAPMSILRAFFLAGYTASVPALVGRSQIARANSYLRGDLFDRATSWGRRSRACCHRRSVPVRRSPSTPSRSHCLVWRSRSCGVTFGRRSTARGPAWSPRSARASTSSLAIRCFARSSPSGVIVSISTAPLVSALAVHVTRDLGQEDAILGLILTAYGVGTVVGSLLTARASRRAVASILLGGTLVTGCCLVVVALVDQVPVLLAVALASGVAQSMVLVTYITAADRVLARRAARPHRQHGPDDLARAAADRPARRRCAHRPDERLDDHRRDGRSASWA